MARKAESCSLCAHEYPIYSGDGVFGGLGCMLSNGHGAVCEDYKAGVSKYKHATVRWLTASGEKGDIWVTPENPYMTIGRHIQKEQANRFRAPKPPKKRGRKK